MLVPAVLVLPQGLVRTEVPAGTLTAGDVIDNVGTVGAGATSAALIPKLLSSVDPSGIATLVDDDPMEVGIAADEPVVALKAVELHVLPTAVGVIAFPDPDEVPPVDVVPPMPPPSNVVIPEFAVGEVEQVMLLSEPRGLKPPGLSSTAPNGIFVGATGVSGDVVPIAGVMIVLT